MGRRTRKKLVTGPGVSDDTSSVKEQMERFTEFVSGWAHDQVWVVADLLRRECVRYAEDADRSVGAVPDPGKEFRDQGTETEKGGREKTAPDPGKEVRDQGSQTEKRSKAPVEETPLPGELVARLEDMSSRLAANSDRLEVIERRLMEGGSNPGGSGPESSRQECW